MIKMPKIRVTQIVMAATIVVFSFIRPLQVYTIVLAWGLKRFIDYYKSNMIKPRRAIGLEVEEQK